MAGNIQKFVNPKFIRTVPLDLLRRLLERHLRDSDLKPFAANNALVRERLGRYLRDGDDHPDGLIADLHRIAEVGTESGLEVLLEQARRHHVALVVRPGSDPAKEDPKHVALTAFLDHPHVFEDAADIVAFFRRSAIVEFVGSEAGMAPIAEPDAEKAFENSMRKLLRADLLGDYCRVRTYRDGDDWCVVLTHGAPIATVPTLQGAKEQTVCYRPTAQTRLRYNIGEGRLKIGGVRKSRREDVAEAFATTMLGRPGLFAGADARALYSLEPVERDWAQFLIAHQHDPYVRRVRIVEVQLDRLRRDLEGRFGRPDWSVTVVDRRGKTLEILRQHFPHVEFASGHWRLGRMVLWADVQEGGRRPKPVTVTIRPEAEAAFRRQRHEARIMELLRRNGFCKTRIASPAAIAAQ